MHLRVRSSATPGTVRFEVDRSTLDRLRDLVARGSRESRAVEAVVGDARFIIDHSVIAFLRHQMARAGGYGHAITPDLLVTLFTIGYRSTLRAEPIAVAMSEEIGPDEAVGHTSPAAVG
jgi:hypothetical protein